ncbi:uncharacterized protein LOC108330135 [Vigna angularis]|uniref:uncharacterized protein LOC108330135 n=1 Tax=Phaseolus angularis TaxID=3914 RepID=UPI00080A51D7|nr:uncharacterized protein LOC108330135 [Vigna angularis]
MAKFSPEEVSALQAGGNERANQVDLKEWDPLRNSKPDSRYPHKVFASSNIQKLREFIKYVYVERRYTGESSSNLSRIRLSEKEPNASKRSSSFRLEFRTPNSSLGPYPKSDDKNLRYLYDESRSPRYAQKYSRNGGHIRSPIQIEVVDDRYKDDERRNRRLANIETKLKKTSSDDLKKVETVAAPLAEVSKEKAQPLKSTPLTSSQTPYIGLALRQWKPWSRRHNTVVTPPQHRRHTATALSPHRHNTATEPPNRHKRPTTTTHKAASPNLAPNPQIAVNEPTKQRRREHHKIVETTTTLLIHGTSTMGKEREGELETRKGEGNWGNYEYMGTNTQFENLNYCGHYRRLKTLGMLCHQLMTLGK